MSQTSSSSNQEITPEYFVTRMEQLYGEYRPEMKKLMVRWLYKQGLSPTEMSTLAWTVLENVSTGFGKPPDPADCRPIVNYMMTHRHPMYTRYTPGGGQLEEDPELVKISRQEVADFLGDMLKNWKEEEG